MLSSPGMYTTLRSNLLKVPCQRAIWAAGPEAVSTNSVCPFLKDWWSVQTQSGCDPMWPAHLRTALNVAQASLVLGVHDFLWEEVRTRDQNGTG